MLVRRGARPFITQTALNTFLLIVGALTILPFLYTLSTSLLSEFTSLGNSIYIVPVEFHFENYVAIWRYLPLAPAYRNSLIVACVSGVLQILMTTAAAFPLARHRFPGSRVITFAFLGTLFIPSQVILIPTLILLKAAGLMGRLSGVIVTALCDAFAIFVFVGFFRAIPRELEESAKMDGATDIQTFLNIYLPLSMAPIATIALFHFLGVWNDIVLPALVLSVAGTLDRLTLAPMMTMLITTGGVPTLRTISPTPNTKAALIMVNILPILVLYGFLQRYFRKGITLGALKG
jgi:ABC-type glycerol-3-phosphate transport system permease component